MRFATYNVRHGRTRAGQGCVSNRRLGLAVAALDADVVALQEVDRRVLRSWFADQAAGAGSAARMQPVFGATRRLLGGWYGNALLTRAAPGHIEHIRLPVCPGREARAAILASVPIGHEAVSVGVTHLQHRRGRAPSRAEDAGEQLAELEVLLAALATRPAPRVLAGDLNVLPAVAVPALEAAGYRVADTGPTFPAHDPQVRIDYVAAAGLTVEATEVRAGPVSDHRAVVARLTA